MSEVSKEMLLQAIIELSDHVKDISTTLTLHREETATQFAQVNKRFEQIDKRFEQIDSRFEQIDKRFEQIDSRFEQIDKRFEQIDSRLEQVDEKSNQVDKQLHTMSEQLADLAAGQKIFATEVWSNKKDLQLLKNTLGF